MAGLQCSSQQVTGTPFSGPASKKPNKSQGPISGGAVSCSAPTLKPGNQTTVSGAAIRNCRSAGTKQGFFLVSGVSQWGLPTDLLPCPSFLEETANSLRSQGLHLSQSPSASSTGEADIRQCACIQRARSLHGQYIIITM